MAYHPPLSSPETSTGQALKGGNLEQAFNEETSPLEGLLRPRDSFGEPDSEGDRKG